MVLLLLAPALVANPPAYHHHALVELDNLDLGNGHSRAQATSLFAEESGEPLVPRTNTYTYKTAQRPLVTVSRRVLQWPQTRRRRDQTSWN